MSQRHSHSRISIKIPARPHNQSTISNKSSFKKYHKTQEHSNQPTLQVHKLSSQQFENLQNPDWKKTLNSIKSNLFLKWKKKLKKNDFSINQIVFVQCIQEPLWPCRILQIERVPGMVPQIIYKVEFINDKTTALCNHNYMLQYNEEISKELAKSQAKFKTLQKALKMAEKLYQNGLQGSNDQIRAENDSPSTNQSAALHKQNDIKTNKTGFNSVNLKYKKKSDQKSFRPIVLVNNSEQKDLRNRNQSNQKDKQSPSKRSSKRLNLKRQNPRIKKINNFIVQTPKFDSKYFENKLIEKLIKEKKSIKRAIEQTDDQLDYVIPNEETRFQEFSTKKQSSKKKVNQKIQTQLVVKEKKKRVRVAKEVDFKKVLGYLEECLKELEHVQPIKDKQAKIKVILEYLSSEKYIKYCPAGFKRKMELKASKIIEILYKQNREQVFCKELKSKVFGKDFEDQKKQQNGEMISAQNNDQDLLLLNNNDQQDKSI